MNLVRIISGLLHFDRTNWKAVSLCVLAAAVFWIFNAFNKNHSTTLQFPITFEYNHERYVPAKELPQKISINVTGNGWDLFTNSVGFKMPHLLIPIDKPVETKKIPPATLTTIFAGQLGRLHINQILADTFRLRWDERDMHKYKLEADLSGITFEKGFGRISHVVILPDSVSLEGPQSLLHELADPITLTVAADDIHSNFKSEVAVQIKHTEFIKTTPPKAMVIFDVGQVTEVQKKIPLIVHRSKSKDSVSVWFQIPVDKVHVFETDRSDITASRKGRRFEFSHLPSYALVIKKDSIK